EPRSEGGRGSRMWRGGFDGAMGVRRGRNRRGRGPPADVIDAAALPPQSNPGGGFGGGRRGPLRLVSAARAAALPPQSNPGGSLPLGSASPGFGGGPIRAEPVGQRPPPTSQRGSLDFRMSSIGGS